MSQPINLNKVRKAKAKKSRRAKAKENRILHGRSKAQKAFDADRLAALASHVEAHKREPE